LADRWLTADEQAVVARGDARFEGVVRHALVAAVERIQDASLVADVERATSLLDLLELCRVKIPFDAQTRFARVWSTLAADARRVAAPFAHRLGFTQE